MPPIVSQSNDQRNDRLLGPQGLCGHAPAGLAQDRCGYGPRVPMLVISPYAKTNFVDHTPLSISFLTLSSNQIMSHVQFEMFCSEVLPYPYSEISK